MEGNTASIVTGSVERVFPFMEWGGIAANWMLFETERAASPQPWLAGTLMLFNTKVVLNASHAPLIASITTDPHAEARQVLAKPALMMSETVTEDFTLGSAWAFMDAPSRSLTKLELTSSSSIKSFRTLDFVSQGRANFLLCFEYSEDHVVFMYAQELNGRTNCLSYGFIDRNSRICTIVSRTENSLMCAECSTNGSICECEGLLLDHWFESKYWQRQGWLTKHLSRSCLGSDFFKSWLGGVWTARSISLPGVPPYRIEVNLLLEGPSFDHSLTFVIQNEVNVLHPPRASQRFVASLKDVLSESDEWSATIGRLQDPFSTEDPNDPFVLSKRAFQSRLDAATDRSQYSLSKTGAKNAFTRNRLEFLSKMDRRPGNNENQAGRNLDTLFESMEMSNHQSHEKARGDSASTGNSGHRTVPREKREPDDELVNMLGTHVNNVAQYATQEEEPNRKGSAPASTSKKTFVCPVCNSCFQRRNDMDRHQRIIHEKRRDFKCEYCGKSFTHSGHLNSHVRVSHEGNRDFACSECSKVFDAKSKLERHILHVHLEVRMFKCETCSKSFKDRFFLKRHRRRQHPHESSDAPKSNLRT